MNLNSLPKDRVLELSKLKSFADYKIYVTQTSEICFWEG